MNKKKLGLMSCLCSLSILVNAHALEITEEGSSTEATPRIIKEQQIDTSVPVKSEQKSSIASDKIVSKKTTNSNKTTEEDEIDISNLRTKGSVYVADSIDVYVTRGPGRQYRISGTVKPGDKLNVLEDVNGYYKVLTSKNKIVWIPKKYTQDNISYKEQSTTLAKENAELKYKLEHIDSETARELKEATKELANLKKAHAELQAIQSEEAKKLKELTKENEDLESRLETKDQDMQIRWWKQGAFIALLGAIVAVILVYLPKPRRRKNDYYY
ncbi:MAG: TIGR04211 family SH3 domain-containing protein [Succinivibrionaceae bacterium]